MSGPSLASTDSEPMVLEVLQRQGLLDPALLAEARQAIAKASGSPERALIRAGLVEDRVIADAYADEFLLAHGSSAICRGRSGRSAS